MFGIIRPCRHRMSEGMATSWVAHLCGLCLALRDGHGQVARVATNYDGLVISVLVEAQTPADARQRRTAGPCPLRGMRTAPVAVGEGARLAAAVSLVLASAKMRDHVADRDGAYARRPVAAAARGMAKRWDRAGARTGGDLGFDTAVLVEAVDRQTAIEAAAGPGTPLLTITEPTETATAAAFAHTAVLAGRPANKAPLEEAGRLFGRLAHLLDAVEDLAEDTRTGAWNPLLATGTDLAEARRLCSDAVHGIRLALRDADFANSASGRLAHVLLVHELGRSVDRAFGGHSCAHPDHAKGAGTAAGSAGPGVLDGTGGAIAGLAVEGSGNPFGPNPYAPNQPGAPGTPGDPGQSPYAPGGPGFPGGFPPPEPPGGRRRGLVAGCLVFAGLFCTCRVCCAEHENAWTGRRKDPLCDCCDCCDCDGCDCCDWGNCGECCNCCDGCDCCDCDCGC